MVVFLDIEKKDIQSNIYYARQWSPVTLTFCFCQIELKFKVLTVYLSLRRLFFGGNMTSVPGCKYTDIISLIET